MSTQRCCNTLARHITKQTHPQFSKASSTVNKIRRQNILSSKFYSTTRTSLYSFDSNSSGDGTGLYELHRWPLSKTNTILNIVPQGKLYIVERLGKLEAIQPSGYFFAIPFIDQVAYVIDTRERAIDITPQSAITRDNVSVEVSGNLFVQFVDAEKAAYGARNPLYSVVQVS